MLEAGDTKRTRRPRFRRAAPPSFRVTDNDVTILRLLARHRFLQSTHIAALVDRSLDRINDRLSRLFHAGYVDRPRAQLDYYPTAGSAPMVYAIADLGAHLLSEREHIPAANVEWSRKNREVGRPFIEHQLEIMDFHVALERAARMRSDIGLVHSDELISAFPEQTHRMRSPLAMRISILHNDRSHEIGLIPDLIFGVRFPDGSRRCFMVEIDRGTMPIIRADIAQTSFERKMRSYLAAHAAKQHQTQFGWKTFRVLVVTTDRHRAWSMREALQKLHGRPNPGPSLFLFATRDELRAADPITYSWEDGMGSRASLV